MHSLEPCWDVVVVGAGPAGCHAALAARAAGATVLLIDMAHRLGGALAALGLLYPWQNTQIELLQAGVCCSYQTTLMSLEAGLQLRLLSPQGIARVQARAVVVATGGRELTRGNLDLPGTRPAGVLTAGAALRLLAETKRRLGDQVVIAGQGRWLALTAQMLEQTGVQLCAISTSVVEIVGWPRISHVLLDANRSMLCDLLVLATPTIPWLAPSLAHARDWPGVFVAGAAAHGEIDAATAAALGTVSGQQAAAWARTTTRH